MELNFLKEARVTKEKLEKPFSTIKGQKKL